MKNKPKHVFWDCYGGYWHLYDPNTEKISCTIESFDNFVEMIEYCQIHNLIAHMLQPK